MSRGAPRSAADRVLSLLDALVHSAPQGTLADLAVAANLPKPTAHRLLGVLVAHGYAVRETPGCYAPGHHLLSLAVRLPERTDIPRIARVHLVRLRDVTRETVHLALLDGHEIIYGAKLEPPGPFRMASRVGTVLCPYSTAIGKAILGFVGDSEREAILSSSRPFIPRTPRTLVDEAELLRHLSLVRAQGYAIDDEENEAEVRCIGAPIFDHRALVVGGVSVSGSVYHLTPRKSGEIRTSVVLAAHRISTDLACPPESLPLPALPLGAELDNHAGRVDAGPGTAARRA